MQSILLLIAFAFMQTTGNAQNWNQLDIDIDGEAAGDLSGRSVSLSADGLTLAIGAHHNGGNGLNAGHVRVYKRISGVWTQLGIDINGEAAGDLSGLAVSLSADGLILAIGAVFNSSSSGHVRVYKFISGVWTQQGADIDGEEIFAQSGWSVSLSADGLTLAIGAVYNSENGFDAGHVRVYKFLSGVWTQQGADIDGAAAFDQLGYSVSLSADGLFLAIGAAGDSFNGTGVGYVRVYNFISGVWTQLGIDIVGEAAGDRSGTSVSLSADGLILAIGAPLNDGNGTDAGHVRVYKFISGVWTQQGADIDGEAALNRSGTSVSLSADGLTLAIGAPRNDGNGTEAGHTQVYKFISGVWTQQGADIEGEAAGDLSGRTVSLSADGLILAIGAPSNTGNGPEAGHVRVYGDPTVGIDENSPFNGISIFPNPTTKLVTIELNALKDVTVQVFNMNGQLLYIRTGIHTATHQFELTGPPGIYLIELISNGETQRHKLVKE